MLKVFWGYFRAVILAVIVGLAAVTATEIEKIPDASMEPLIEHDDFVFINKAVYVYKEPEAGDVVALRSRLHTSSGGGAVIASRVAGAAGDVIELPGGEKETVKETYTDEELERLLKRPAKNCDFAEYRSWVIVNFLMNSGCRAATVRNIQNRETRKKR